MGSSKLKTIKLDATCPSCGEHSLTSWGETITWFLAPTGRLHRVRCSHCGELEILVPDEPLDCRCVSCAGRLVATTPFDGPEWRDGPGFCRRCRTLSRAGLQFEGPGQARLTAKLDKIDGKLAVITMVRGGMVLMPAAGRVASTEYRKLSTFGTPEREARETAVERALTSDRRGLKQDEQRAELLEAKRERVQAKLARLSQEHKAHVVDLTAP